MSEPRPCGHQYPLHETSRGTRIVECQLEAGHDGPHIEYWDETRIGRSEWPQTAPSGRTDPGEGNGTGSGAVEAQNGSQRSALDAAIEAATKALNREADGGGWAIGRMRPDREYKGLFGVNGDARDLSEITVAAAEPLIRKAAAEQIAAAIEARRAALVAVDNIEDDWDDGTDSLLAAAEIAREVGRGRA